ncbi:hypothetical protein JOC37_002507 [Desulfohalotomaculum tongense]|uniref:hypothetical protein n=1 Tax=Desulforadius tongensis TaxID=1216062 RepID=UPI00195EEEBA|nr:hypothetical protein [Desulforadius tongensis]MBM7856082.1 hypothetical protein [Desulforadius tongensis]
MSDGKKVEFNHPYEVGDLVVYLVDKDLAYVIDYDCRYELTTTTTSCDCCTFLFRSRINPNFQCRHIKALRTVLGLD